jgi:hypothetical protein
MKSIKIILSNLLLSTIFFSCSSQLPAYEVSLFEKGEIEYDHYDEDGNLFYEISKDKDNLLIDIRANDLPTQIKILNNGVKICIDETGKKKCDNYIQFPVKNNKQDLSELKPMTRNRDEILKMKLSTLSDEFLFVKNHSKEYLSRNFNTQNISTDITIDEGVLDYMIKIPLESIIAKSSQSTSLGIVIDGITRPVSSSSNQGGRSGGVSGRPSGYGGGRPSGVGGGKPSGVSGGRMSGNSGEMSQFKSISKDIKIWNKLKISK